MGRVMVGVAAGLAAVACVVAAVAVGRRMRSRGKWKRVVRVLREVEEGCETSVGRLRQVVDAMAVEMHAGLASEGGSKLKMLITFVHNLPNGTEKGTYYALDLGGTNFRVLRVHLHGQQSSVLEHEVERQPIPQHLMTSTSEVGIDVPACMQEALTRKGLDVRVAALANDTVGTLALGHYNDSDTVASVIIGTGTNACYLERVDAIIKCQGLLTASGYMVEGFIAGMGFVLTPMMAAMHEDDSPDLREVARILKDILEIPDVPLKLRKVVVKVCDVVTRRAARLAAAGIVGILKKIGRDGSGGITGGRRSEMKMKRTVVAIEGGLYSSYTLFREYLHEALNDILGEDIAKHVTLKVTEDGSGVGAALLAASHSSYDVDTV
ncbi:hypothetical protein JHK87_030432 [Glycine soja]|nr:hypothetical protein JHK87_030432 [Glycine soja]